MDTLWRCQHCNNLSDVEPIPFNVVTYRTVETSGGKQTFSVNEVVYLCKECVSWSQTSLFPAPTTGGHALIITGVDENGNPIAKNGWGAPGTPLDNSKGDGDVEC